MNVWPLYEGTYSVGTDGRFNRIERDDPPARGALKISINPFLIREKERIILIDAGLGEFGEQTSTDTIKSNLQELGLNEYEITDIFISHLHFDHIGGLVGWPDGYPELTFPNARLWISRCGWEHVLHPENLPTSEKRIEFLHFLDARADLHLLDDEEQPYPEIRVRKGGGHTPCSQIIYYEGESIRCLMAGDILGRRSSAKRRYQAKYDHDPERAMLVREEVKQLALEEGYIILAYHESGNPLFRITEDYGNGSYEVSDP